MSANVAKAQALQKLIRAVETAPFRPRPAVPSPQIRCWMAALEALPPPCSMEGQRLLADSRRFALTCAAEAAIDAGWTEGDLFCRDEGLVPLALARGAQIVAVTGDMAELRIGCAGERFPRPATGAPPWWNDLRTTGSLT